MKRVYTDVELYKKGLFVAVQFPVAPLGVLAPGSAHARPSAQPPINTSGNFWHMCLGGGESKKSDQLSPGVFKHF